jgi:hypothetical protein
MTKFDTLYKQIINEHKSNVVQENILSKLNPFKKKEAPVDQEAKAKADRKQKFAQSVKDLPRLKAPYSNYSITHFYGRPGPAEPEMDNYYVIDHEALERYPDGYDSYSSEEQAMEKIKEIEKYKK